MEYVFKKFDGSGDRMLVCPICREFIARSDIEHFRICPYCGASLEMTDELEDFLLDPIVADWTLYECASRPYAGPTE